MVVNIVQFCGVFLYLIVFVGGGVFFFVMNILICKTNNKNFSVKNAWDFMEDIDFFVRVDETELCVEYTFWKHITKGYNAHVARYGYIPRLLLLARDYNVEYRKYVRDIYWKKVKDDDVVFLYCFKGSHPFFDTVLLPFTSRNRIRWATDMEVDMITRMIVRSLRREYGIGVDDELRNSRKYQRFVRFCESHKLGDLL